MIAIAHFVAISCYVGAHVIGIVIAARQLGQLPVSGLGPALSLAGLMVAATLLVAEIVTLDVTLTLVAGPLAAIVTTIANLSRVPTTTPVPGGAWLISHIALSFFGIAAFATSAAAGTMYLLERRELRSRRFAAVLRFFPPLQTLDRVNQVGILIASLSLTLGIVLATTYSIAHNTMNLPEIIWGVAVWLAATGLAFGRMLGGWQARRAAVAASVMFVVIVALYVAVRLNVSVGGSFL
jgi:HemX protein